MTSTRPRPEPSARGVNVPIVSRVFGRTCTAKAELGVDFLVGLDYYSCKREFNLRCHGDVHVRTIMCILIRPHIVVCGGRSDNGLVVSYNIVWVSQCSKVKQFFPQAGFRGSTPHFLFYG